MDATNRYHRQTLLPQIGREGQARLSQARVLLVGCGALGSVIAEQLVRAGAGLLRIADRDLVEWTNLQRQVLFDEADARAELPKAVAARQRLGDINSNVTVEAIVADVDAGNVEALAGLEPGGRRVDLILDGTDNVETRHLLNEVAVKHGIPWVYGACVGTEGRVMAVRPPDTACLRCVFPEPPAPAELPTCDTAGVLGPVAAVVASLQAVAAIKLLSGNGDAVGEELTSFDLWNGRWRTTLIAGAKRADCPVCGHGRFEMLHRRAGGRSTRLCGGNAVQVRPAAAGSVDLRQLETKLRHSGQMQRTPFLLRCQLAAPEGLRLTVFADGRAIIEGTSDLERARSVYARYVGS